MYEDLQKYADECGFECTGTTEASKLETREEVRDMCAANLCQHYGHSWACPPACGTVEEYGEKIKQHKDCFIFQTVAQLEDEFDFETIAEAAETHAQRTFDFIEKTKKDYPDALFLTAGTCNICPECTYPDEPCRNPDMRFTSMEASGLVVSDVCNAAEIPYNHGKNTLAYVSCVLI